MKLITGREVKGLFVKDNFFTKKQFVEVREWAKDHIRSGLGCGYKTGLSPNKFVSASLNVKFPPTTASPAEKLYDINMCGKPEDIIIKKVYKLLEPLKLQCLGQTDTARNEVNKKDFEITDITFDIHSTHNKNTAQLYNLDWHQDPTTSLAFLIYIHDVWEDDWGGDYIWSKQVGIQTDPDLDPEKFQTGGIIKCKPNRIIIDTININHKLSPINTESERMAIHGWAW